MYALILMDYSIPEMDGPTCVSKIRSILSKSSQRPYICCVTAYSEEVYKRNALGNGMDEFMTKPIFKG